MMIGNSIEIPLCTYYAHWYLPHSARSLSTVDSLAQCHLFLYDLNDDWQSNKHIPHVPTVGWYVVLIGIGLGFVPHPLQILINDVYYCQIN